MEISDRRYMELKEAIRVRQGGTNTARTPVWTLRIPSQVVAATPLEPRHAATPPTSAAQEVKKILLVDCNLDALDEVRAALCLVADVEACSDFLAARARLRAQPPDLLVTNIRLQAYNGLHLIYLAGATKTRCIAYSMDDDVAFAREVQAAGGFYERLGQLSVTLPAYVNGMLPGHDRRNAIVLDRRRFPRGGRRWIDLRRSIFSQQEARKS